MGWIPFLGLIACAIGVVYGIKAIEQGKKAEEYNISGSGTFASGWIAIGAAILWTSIYMLGLVIWVISAMSQGGR